MPTFDEIQLQKLLRPFEENRGIVNTNNAIPMIDTFSLFQQNQIPLVDQIIAENLSKTTPMDFTNAPQDYYPTTGIIDSTPARKFEFQKSAYEDDDVEQIDYLSGAKPKKGIARLFELLGKIPTPFNLARRGIESLSKIPKSDFFKSKNLMDYLDMRRYGGAEARERARQKNLRETAAIQKQLDLRTAAGMYDVRGDRGRSVAAKEAATRSKDLQSMRGGVGR